MEYGLSEQQRMLQQSARDFLRKEVPSSLVRDMAAHDTGHSPELWEKMAGMGWMALAVPEDYGGCEMSFVDLVILLEEMGRACLQGPYFSTVILGAATILEAANEEQRRRLLPALASGDLLVTLAVTERQAIHNSECLETKAEYGAEDYRIEGIKLFVPDAKVAHHIVCVAQTDSGATLFLVDSRSNGLSISPLPTMAGDKQYEVRFDGVRVPSENVLGTPGSGWQHWQRVEARAAIAKCAELMGGAQQVLDLTVSYARDRVQFGRPIGSFQAIQHYLANMSIDVDCAKYLTYQAAWLISEHRPCAKEIAMAKAWTGAACQRVSALGIQIHGAIGFSWEHDMHLFFKQAKLGEVSFGDAAYHEQTIAREIGL